MAGKRWRKALSFINFRTLRNTPSVVWKELSRSEAVAIVANGETKAIMVAVEDGDAEEAVDLVRQLRAQRALSRLRAAAQASGASEVTETEIDAEVAAARKARLRG